MLCFNWFENLEEPKSYSWDILRPYLGLDEEGAHDALKDVQDTARIIIRFMKLHRQIADCVKFKGSFKE